MDNLSLALLKDPVAIVELFSAFLVAFYMLQLVMQNGGIGKIIPGPRFQSRRDLLSSFHRAVFLDLSDRGALFPSRKNGALPSRKNGALPSRKRREDNHLRLFAVGSYVSSKKRSLRKSSAQRIRLPE